MPAGQAGRDLGRISIGPWSASCTAVGCPWRTAPERRAKAATIRLARIHVAGTGHVVHLRAYVVQTVDPR